MYSTNQQVLAKIKSLSDLYEYFDALAEDDQTDPDTLFASSYLRGFIALTASEFGDESQLLSTPFATSVTEKLHEARSELSPADKVIVNNFWSSITDIFSFN